MESLRQTTMLPRLLAWSLLVWVFLASLASAAAQEGGAVEPSEPTQGYVDEGEVKAPAKEGRGFFIELISNLFNSEKLLDTLKNPNYIVAIFIILNLIVFVETGLLIGFFLPGDSLLVTAGIAAEFGGWNVPLLLVTLSLSAIIGDSLGYAIGLRAGPRIFNRPKSWLFKKDHLLKAQEFYEKHGGKTIVLARFMPIIRTFAPVVAGAGKMDYRRFLFFNIFGGIGWVVSMVMIGYILTWAIDPLFKSLLGDPNFTIHRHVEKVVIVVVLLSISPAIYLWLRKKFGKKTPAAPLPAPAAHQVAEATK